MKFLATTAVLALSSLSLAETTGTYYSQTIVKPFGYVAPRPPANVRVVSLDDIKIEFSARQVCGYTDWSSATVALPREILTARYWGKVGQKAKSAAIDSVLAISGALPSMLACNASPTFCAVLNRAEALAQANLKFTFDSCQILEGLSDASKSHFQPLKSCVGKQVNKNGMTASTALDKCTLGEKDRKRLTKQRLNLITTICFNQ